MRRSFSWNSVNNSDWRPYYRTCVWVTQVCSLLLLPGESPCAASRFQEKKRGSGSRGERAGVCFPYTDSCRSFNLGSKEINSSEKNISTVTPGRRWEDSAADQHRQTQLSKHSAAKSQLGVHICVKYIREMHGCRHKGLQKRAEEVSQLTHSLYLSWQNE